MILVISGGMGEHSLNVKLARLGLAYLEAKGVESVFLDLAAYDLPLLLPTKVSEAPSDSLVKVRSFFEQAQGFFITTPEYNGGITPVLSNLLNSVFNFVYFPKETLFPIKSKPVLVGSASPSIYGGLKANESLNAMLHHMGAIVCPNSMALSQANQLFDAATATRFKDNGMQGRLEDGLSLLVKLSQS